MANKFISLAVSIVMIGLAIGAAVLILQFLSQLGPLWVLMLVIVGLFVWISRDDPTSKD